MYRLITSISIFGVGNISRMARERKGSSSTLADEVYAQIKADVIQGRLRPGSG